MAAARRRLFWDLYLSSLILTLVAVVFVGRYTAGMFDRFYVEQVRADLAARASIFASELARHPDALKSPDLQSRCCVLGNEVQTRLTVIDAGGVVLADSEHDPATMENHGQRPEIAEALTGHTGSATRFSTTLRQRTVYVAVPVMRDGRVVGVTRAALAVTVTDALAVGMHRQLSYAIIGAILSVALVVYLTARRISRPFEQMRTTAERFAAGDLTARAEVHPWVELASLATTLNGMAASLDDRIRTVVRQRNELETVLSGMTEGVLAIDRDERVLGFNASAARVLGLDAARDRGRSIYEAIRHPGLQRLAAQVLRDGLQAEEVFAFDIGERRSLCIRGSVLSDAAGQRVGVLLVIEDLTTLQRLEKVRRDFVANASHELKTPVTAIKGYVETLADGALEDPAHARQFLQIVAEQVERLEAIVNDLLLLSRVEHTGESGSLELSAQPLDALVKAAVDVCRPVAANRSVRLSASCGAEAKAAVNARLLEQALINLIDNAIKHSAAGGSVTVEAACKGDSIELSVADQGCGIAPEHLERIFERFYRVDKARSDAMGGTGLGLAIVKHIVALHRGRVAVESAIGKGSTFTIVLPNLSAETGTRQ